MRKILVPVDFSEAADNALRYCVGLAASQLEPIELILLHVYEGTKSGGTAAEANSLQLQNEQDALKKLQAYGRSWCRLSEVKNCRTLVAQGQLPKAIASAANHCQADLIVMGTKGASATGSFFNDTHTSGLIEQAACPVLVVPEKLPFRAVLRIVFAADLSLTELADLQRVAELAISLNAQVQVVHVSGVGAGSKDDGKIARFWRAAKEQIHYPLIDFTNIEAHEIAEGLEDFMQDQHADLLVVSPHRRSIFHRMLYGNPTRKVVIDALVPVLTLPHSEEDRSQFSRQYDVLRPMDLAI